MALYLIGIGLGDEEDITVKGFHAVKRCSKVYLESYTSRLVDADISKLEKFYSKKIILADRELVENTDEIIEMAKTKNVAFLVVGDVFGATTHINLLTGAIL